MHKACNALNSFKVYEYTRVSHEYFNQKGEWRRAGHFHDFLLGPLEDAVFPKKEGI